MPIRSRRGQAILALLVLSPHAKMSRDRLAATLWPDRSEEQVKASLRQELSRLRKCLGDDAELVSADNTYVWLDQNVVNPAFGSEQDGTFLEGLDLRSEPFEDWRREQFARLASEHDEGLSGETEASPPQDIFQNPTVLVLGFVPASPEQEDVTFATGLVIDLRNSLALWRWFPVMGPEVVGWKTERDGNICDLSASVGATYAISGTVRRAGNLVRVSVGLTHVDSGHLAWTATFDGEMNDVFEMQEAIGRGVVARVVPEIGRAEAVRVARNPPSHWSAWHLVAQTEELERTGGEGYGTPESNAAQVPLLEQAIAFDTEYARAWARLGRYYFRAAMQGWIPDRDDAIKKALELTQRAVTIDPSEWEGQSYRALTLIFGKHAFGPARAHAEEAVRLNPSAPIARHAMGCALEWLGEPQEGLRHLRRVFELNPNHANRAAVLGDITTCELLVGNLDAAVDAARQLRDIAPEYIRGLQRVVVTLSHAGLVEEAAETLAKVNTLQSDFDEAYVRQTYPYARSEHVETILEGLRRAGWAG